MQNNNNIGGNNINSNENSKSVPFHIVINNKYTLAEEIGRGAFGIVYYGIDIDSQSNVNNLVAIKLEQKGEKSSLKREAEAYTNLHSKNKGIPQLYWYGEQDKYNVMIIELIGPSIEQLRISCKGQFTIPTVCYIGKKNKISKKNKLCY